MWDKTYNDYLLYYTASYNSTHLFLLSLFTQWLHSVIWNHENLYHSWVFSSTWSHGWVMFSKCMVPFASKICRCYFQEQKNAMSFLKLISLFHPPMQECFSNVKFIQGYTYENWMTFLIGIIFATTNYLWWINTWHSKEGSFKSFISYW